MFKIFYLEIRFQISAEKHQKLLIIRHLTKYFKISLFDKSIFLSYAFLLPTRHILLCGLCKQNRTVHIHHHRVFVRIVILEDKQ